MSYYNLATPIRKIGPAISAGIALFFSGALSISGLNLFGSYIAFAFVPLTVLIIWPRRAHALLSIAIIFLAGIFTDWATGGLFGQWALTFIVVWALLRPELRSSPYAVLSLLFVWFIACALAALVVSVSGWFVYNTVPDLRSLGRQAVLATFILPLVLLLRFGVATLLGDNDDWGG